MRLTRLILCCAGISAGCAQASIQRDGFVLERDRTDELLASLSRRAAFDLQCPAQEIDFTILAVHDDMGPDMPKQVGVVGCNKRATYTMEYIQTGGGSSWVGWGGARGWSGGSIHSYTHETGWRLDAMGVQESK